MRSAHRFPLSRPAALLSCAAVALACATCSDPKAGPSLGSSGTATPDGGSDAGAGGDGAGGAAGQGDAGGSGYSPLDPAVKGNWMQPMLGNCINVEEWLVLAPPETLVRTVIDRNACQPPSLSKVAGTMKILPNQVLELTFQDKVAYRLWRRTAAVLDSVVGVPEPQLADPSYKKGSRGLTLLAFVRATPGGPFVRSDVLQEVTDKPKADTRKTTNVQIQVAPAPDTAKAGEPCTLSATISAQYEPGGTDPITYGSEKLEFPCHFATDPGTGWLRILADGHETSLAWDKYFDSKGLWKKYSKPVAQLLYDSFRPNLLQPPAQRGVLVSLAAHGWYYEFINEPPTSIK
ncbi:MAG: hypothetical protein FJ100_10160 [Deltaproteobacteria bacterium]|nr:hypothetical protein [Deltaproteobacteria bacterium]